MNDETGTFISVALVSFMLGAFFITVIFAISGATPGAVIGYKERYMTLCMSHAPASSEFTSKAICENYWNTGEWKE